MSDMLACMQAHAETQRHQFERVMRCDEAPPTCFTCAMLARRSGKPAAPATHVTTTITPAGYHAWQCREHVPRQPEKPWRTDPGWPSAYQTIDAAREAFRARESRA